VDGAERTKYNYRVDCDQHDGNLDECKVGLDIVTESGLEKLLGEELDINRLVLLVKFEDLFTQSPLPKGVELLVEVVVSGLLDAVTEAGCFGLFEVVESRAEVLVNLSWLSFSEEAVDKENLVGRVARAQLDLVEQCCIAGVSLNIVLDW